MTPFRDIVYAGYSIIFISHSTEKPYTDDNGEEYQKIVPALPNRPLNLVNKMVDVIGYIRQISSAELTDERYLYFRSGRNVLTKSRFAEITPKIALNYEDFRNAILDAIEKEAEKNGQTPVDEKDDFYNIDFNSLMEEAKSYWIKANQLDKAEVILSILEKTFGKPIRFSEITATDADKLNEAINEIKSIFG